MQGVEGEMAQGGVERASQQRAEWRVDFGAGRTSQRKEGAGGGAGCFFVCLREARPSSHAFSAYYKKLTDVEIKVEASSVF